MAREPRSENIVVRFTARDKAAIERAATKAGMTTSEFIRAAALTTMAISADPHALRELGRAIVGLVAKPPGRVAARTPA